MTALGVVLCRIWHNLRARVKQLIWVGSARADLMDLPDEVQDVFGYALYLAQVGDKHPDAKPLKGFSGAGVLEVIEDHAGDTYRAVYTVTFSTAVYTLHVFQKKSTRGIATPRREIELIQKRLAWAEQIHGQLTAAARTAQAEHPPKHRGRR
jgi:phage-related protein